MDEFTKPSILRLARKAGVKTMSDDCYNSIRNLIGLKLDNIIQNLVVVNNQKCTKTVMVDDLIETLNMMGYNLTKSNDLNISTYKS